MCMGRASRIITFQGLQPGTGLRFRVQFVLEGLLTRSGTALARWLRTGGVPASRRHRTQLARERRRQAKDRKEAVRRRAAAGLESSRLFGSVSGLPAPTYDASEKIHVEISGLKCRRAIDDRWSKGLTADKRGRWAVVCVLLARYVGNTNRWQALISWAGAHKDCWVDGKDLCGEARRDALDLSKAHNRLHEQIWSDWLDSSSDEENDKLQALRETNRRVIDRVVRRSDRLKRKADLIATAIVPWVGETAPPPPYPSQDPQEGRHVCASGGIRPSHDTWRAAC